MGEQPASHSPEQSEQHRLFLDALRLIIKEQTEADVTQIVWAKPQPPEGATIVPAKESLTLTGILGATIYHDPTFVLPEAHLGIYAMGARDEQAYELECVPYTSDESRLSKWSVEVNKESGFYMLQGKSTEPVTDTMYASLLTIITSQSIEFNEEATDFAVRRLQARPNLEVWQLVEHTPRRQQLLSWLSQQAYMWSNRIFGYLAPPPEHPGRHDVQ